MVTEMYIEHEISRDCTVSIVNGKEASSTKTKQKIYEKIHKKKKQVKVTIIFYY